MNDTPTLTGVIRGERIPDEPATFGHLMDAMAYARRHKVDLWVYNEDGKCIADVRPDSVRLK